VKTGGDYAHYTVETLLAFSTAFAKLLWPSVIIRLHLMHSMQPIVTDNRGVCQSVCQAALHCAEVMRRSHCQITSASCYLSADALGIRTDLIMNNEQ